MQCQNCDGKGKIITGRWNDRWEQCEKCNGTGEIQTNEEWFDNLPTDEKAKELQLIYISGRTDEFYDKPQKMVRKFIQWLKQPHKQKG